MNKRKLLYNNINIVVIIAIVLLFIYEYNKNLTDIFAGKSYFSILILIITVILVHTIKAGRLYLALYGLEIKAGTYLKTYCKVTPVSVVVPFKLGEFFRMYCYGKQLGSVLKGIVIILLDRFMDTIALVTAIFMVLMFNGGRIPSMVYLLLIFLVFVLLIYFVFPGVYKFWKKYLLRANASEHKLAILKMLEILNMVYHEIEGVAKGRGVILYLMSLIAWAIEIGSVTLLNGVSGNRGMNEIISSYLTSAMSGSQSIQLKQFLFASVFLLIATYVIIKAVELIDGKKVER